MAHILIVEDESSIRRLIATVLQKQGYEVTESGDGEDAFSKYEETPFDLVVTDVMMPLVDGNQLVRQIRKINKEVPILMLTALDAYADKEKSYLSGADDYMVKPIDMNEMMLRIRALLRRVQTSAADKIVLPHLTLDNGSGELRLNGEIVELPRKEFQLLYRLLSHPGRIFTREQLMNDIWGFDSQSYERTIDTHVKRIREHVPTNDFEIVTVRGLGYKAVVR